jgi:septin family protein
METGREDVDGHPHPARNQSSPQEYSADQEIQKIPPFAVVSGGRRAEEYRDGNAGDD